MKKYNFLIVVSILIKFIISAIVILVFFKYLNDNKFLEDSNTIYSIYINSNSYNLNNIFHNSGFENTALILRVLSIGKILSYNELLVFCFLIYIVIYIFLVKNTYITNNHKLYIIFNALFIFDAIFLFQPSKDLFAILNSIIILKIFKSGYKKYNNILLVLLMMMYALLFRNYYIIILFSFFFITIYTSVNNINKRIMLILLFIILYYLFYYTNYLDPITNVRSSYAYLKDIGTKTFINNVIPYNYSEKSIIKYILNYVIIVFRILFPIELIWKSPSRAIVFIPIQIFFTIILIKRVKLIKFSLDKIDKSKIYTIKNIVIYCISFILTSALFEPDFGSVFRHFITIMPFIVYLIFSVKRTDSIGKFMKVRNVLR